MNISYSCKCARCNKELRSKQIHRFSIKHTGVDWKDISDVILHLMCSECAVGLEDRIKHYMEYE